MKVTPGPIPPALKGRWVLEMVKPSLLMREPAPRQSGDVALPRLISPPGESQPLPPPDEVPNAPGAI
eukprot:15440597-Alexandrium_andersonii.AAC.1